MKYAALLRGINMGASNRLAMKDLIALFEEAGCQSATAYIQSGNVVFTAPAALAKTLPAAIQQRIADRFGYKIPVILRTGPQLAAVIEGNPWLQRGAPEKELYVSFLAGTPAEKAVQSLDPARSAPDAFHVYGQEIYLHMPNGSARSKLTNAWFDSKLATISTARNWATVMRLFEMTQT